MDSIKRDFDLEMTPIPGEVDVPGKDAAITSLGQQHLSKTSEGLTSLSEEKSVDKAPFFAKTINAAKNHVVGKICHCANKILGILDGKAREQKATLVKNSITYAQESIDFSIHLTHNDNWADFREGQLVIDPVIVTGANLPKTLFLGQEKFNKVAYNELQQSQNLNLPIKLALGELTLIPFGHMEGALAELHVVPTADVMPKDKAARKDHVENKPLTNIYFTDSNGHKIIRTGAIHTEARAKDFEDFLTGLHSNQERPLRVVSNQLNSFEAESKLVNGQHAQMAKISAKGSIQIAHINTPTNRLYDITAYFRDTIIGKVVQLFLTGEKLSEKQNVEGWGQYAVWVAQDSKDPKIQAFQGKFEGKLEEINAFNARLGDVKKGPFKEEYIRHKNAIRELRSSIKADLLEMHKILKESERNAPSAFRLLLGSQVAGERISRAQEQLLIKRLNQQVGAISAVNCKSGLDRTGLSNAIELAQQQLYKLYPNDRADIDHAFLNWDRLSTMLFKNEKPVNPADAKAIEKIKIFQNFTLYNLLRAGLPITARSTGVVGLKWNKGLQAQLIPLQFLPEKVEIGGKQVILVKYKNGQPAELTKEGARLLTRMSSMRGS